MAIKNQHDLLNEFLDDLDQIYYANKKYLEYDSICNSAKYKLYRDLLDSFIAHTNRWTLSERERLSLIKEIDID